MREVKKITIWDSTLQNTTEEAENIIEETNGRTRHHSGKRTGQKRPARWIRQDMKNLTRHRDLKMVERPHHLAEKGLEENIRPKEKI